MKQPFAILTLCLLLFPHEVDGQQSDTIRLQLLSDSIISLNEVTVKARRTPASNARYSDITPVELVTMGGANGDLYQALQSLPGTQMQSESGRLLVRGGSSDETATYIDGLHVLNPYASRGLDTPTRGRFSTFMFSGINLSTGAAPLEYGEALSAVLPLDTKDRSPINKLGLNASSVGLGGGGTRAFANGSLSVNLDWQNLSLNNKLFSGRIEFEEPYQMASVATQFRYHPDEATLFKFYAAYDRTDFSNYEGSERRLFSFGENNFYLNSTFRRRTSGGWNWYGGVAFSSFEQRIGSANSAGDHWCERQQELHLKAKFYHFFSERFRLDGGVESLLRSYSGRYRYLEEVNDLKEVTPLMTAAYASASYYPCQQLKGELSLRAEYTSPSRRATLSPRLSLTWHLGEMALTATAGRYTQLPLLSLLAQQHTLNSEACTQYNLGAQYEHNGRFFKAELYEKRYSHLALQLADGLSSTGHGYSRGIDLFMNDRATLKNLEYQLSYTYNDGKRKYQSYTTLTVPPYATRHNAALVLKYSIPRIGTIIGVTERFASGRPFHNPAKSGLMNDEAKPYNSLDIGVTFLPSRKVIIHASATNVLCRRNEYGRTADGKSLRTPNDHFFYLGVFVSIGKKAAYEASGF